MNETPIPFFVESPELSNDVNRHFQEDFINNFNSAVETGGIFASLKMILLNSNEILTM